MRISDWSSDVCSSDLPYACHCTDCQSRTGSAFSEHMLFARADLSIEGELDAGVMTQPSGAVSSIWGCAECKARIFAENSTRPGFGRSEEHTSELQSLMRISYAVFCLKKKKTSTQTL